MEIHLGCARLLSDCTLCIGALHRLDPVRAHVLGSVAVMMPEITLLQAAAISSVWADKACPSEKESHGYETTFVNQSKEQSQRYPLDMPCTTYCPQPAGERTTNRHLHRNI